MSAEADDAEPLSGLLPGQRGRLVTLNVADTQKSRILEMGLTIGTTIEVVRFAPMGDPMELKVRGAHISLRKADAAGLLVRKL